MSDFENAKNRIADRTKGAVSLFDLVTTKGDSEHRKRIKGIAFVEMYAIYENALHDSTKAYLSGIKTAAVPQNKLTAELKSLIRDDDFKSLQNLTSKKKKIDRRIEMFLNLDEKSTDKIDTNLFPSDGSHYRPEQLKTLWKVFSLPGQILPDKRLERLLKEMVAHRNAIAHGRTSPEIIGRSYAPSEIRAKFGQTSRVCRHVIAASEKGCKLAIFSANQ